jgi:PD-(D/E)XK endonuclease
VHPKDIGDRSTLAIILALQSQGCATHLPFGENTRSDLIADFGGRLSRVQCRTGRLRGGSVLFATCSTYGDHANPKVVRRTYQGEIDEFAVFCPELGSVYLIPIMGVQLKKQAMLRVDPPKNRQSARVRWASKYEIARVDVY